MKTRELLTSSMLASLGGCEAQLLGHVAANLSVGNDRRVLLGTITQLLPFIGYPRTLNAIRVINEGTTRCRTSSSSAPTDSSRATRVPGRRGQNLGLWLRPSRIAIARNRFMAST